jgi:hypothetical protein
LTKIYNLVIMKPMYEIHHAKQTWGGEIYDKPKAVREEDIGIWEKEGLSCQEVWVVPHGLS